MNKRAKENTSQTFDGFWNYSKGFDDGKKSYLQPKYNPNQHHEEHRICDNAC
jgi:hypothetical protein